MQTVSARMGLALALLLIGTLCLAGCGPMTATSGKAASAVCGELRPVEWHDDDTDETIRQVKANNAVGRTICGWK